MRRSLLLSALFAVGFAPLPFPKAGKPLSGQGITGSWAVVDDGGENPVRPDGHAKGARWTFDDGGSLVIGDSKEGRHYRLNEGTITVSITPAPAWIGPAAIIQYGLYEVDGDRLRVFLASPGAGQPKAFPKEGGPEQYRVLTLERVR